MLTQTKIIQNEPFQKKVTIYKSQRNKPKAVLLYFHGGGLLYGSREDLPHMHLSLLTDAGYAIVSFDYPLAPALKLPDILHDVCSSINHYLGNPEIYIDEPLPYFLWGRSAGAYLCLLAAASTELKQPPTGILSYYGYGFLCDAWLDAPSNYYLSLPKIDQKCIDVLPEEPHTEGDLDTHYSAYVYARQTGTWKDLIYEGREKFFWMDYSLRLKETLPCPLFAAHSIQDQDVPYQEYTALCDKYHPVRFLVSSNLHDFDRLEDDTTKKLLEETISFLNSFF